MILRWADSCTWQLCCLRWLSFSRRQKWVLYAMTVNRGIGGICTWINCILTTLRQLWISERCRHESVRFVTCKLCLAFSCCFICDPMAQNQGELIIIRSERAEIFRGTEVGDWKWDETVFSSLSVSICSFNNYLNVSHSHNDWGSCYWR